MDLLVGLRVVRGPNWKWGEQDGGEGGVGTVVGFRLGEVEEGTTQQRGVIVQWDAGNRSNYRGAITRSYDLRLFDNGPVGCRHNVQCDACQVSSIAGMRWTCARCYTFNLCTVCYNEGEHNLEHEFFRIVSPNEHRVKVPARLSSRSLTSRGMFTNALVARGRDWLWGDQDGGLGKTGRIQCIRGWESENARSIAEVEWKETGKRNVYRVGHKGKVDIKCTEMTTGGKYYPEHLPIIGADTSQPVQMDLSSSHTHHVHITGETSDLAATNELVLQPVSSTELAAGIASVSKDETVSVEQQIFLPGERIKIELEEDIFKMLQEGHGGWDEELLKLCSQVGTVQSVCDNGDIRVRYSGSKVYTVNRAAATKVRGDHVEVLNFSHRDVVRILDDIATVHSLQEGHGGWVDDMALSLGQAGRVVKVFATGDIRVAVNGRTWTYNPQCLVLAPGENPPEDPPDVPETGGEDLGMQLKLLSLLENPAVIVAAAASGDIPTLREFLSKHPSQVNVKAAGKAAIHCAAVAGNTDVIKCLLEFSPNLEIEDEDGDKPLHLCAYSDEDEVAQQLVDANADVNSKNNKGATPLIIAAVKGHHSVLRILANNLSIRLHEQDSDGDTALHCAVLAQKNESTHILLDAGADPTLLNFRLFTPIHEAARIGFLSAVEQFIRRFPNSMNIKKDDGYTPLHLASLNDHLDVITALAELEMCNLNACTNEGQTALHLAVYESCYRIVERLIGYGVELNTQDKNGDTPLHLAISRASMKTVSAESPQLKKVEESIMDGSDAPQPYIVLVCFLVREGAETTLTNKKGHTPLQLCSAKAISTIMTLKIRSDFHGSMKCPPPSNVPPAPTPVTSLYKSGDKTVPITSKGKSSMSGPDLCFLCEEPVDVKFDPCGHALMCHNCAERARKCPKCKKNVKTISKLKEICVMCKEEDASVTMQPCGHVYCQACSRRLKICFECRAVIDSKEGLESLSKEGPSSMTNTQPCAICLTEPRNTALQCGHLLCWECAQRVDNCPVCRKFVSHRIRLFQ